MKKEKEEKEPMIEDMRHVVSTLYDVMWYMICEDDMICINIFRP